MNLDQVISLEFKTLRRGMLIDDDVKLNENTRELKVVGRKSRVVKIKGELVSLDALEKAFSQICADLKLNEEFVITANLHERDENELVLIVEAKGSYLEWKKALDEFNNKGSAWISRVEFIEKFPRTRLGKISSSI